MENRKTQAATPLNLDDSDVAKWALPEGAIVRFGRGKNNDVAFSPDGQYFAVGSWIGLWLYELPTLSPFALCDTARGVISAVAFSADSRWIVTYTFVENLKVWDVQSGTCITQIEIPNKQHYSRPVFSQDRQRITAASHERDGKIYTWCARTGAQLNAIEIGETHGIYPFLFSQNRNLLAGRKRSTDSDPESIFVWHVETGEQIACFTGYSEGYSERTDNLCFSPDGKYLTAGSAEGTIRIWDIESGQLATTHTDSGDTQMFPHYSPEAGLIAAAISKREVQVWHIDRDEKIDTFEHRGDSWHVRFSDCGTQLAVASESEIKIWTKSNNSNTHTLSTLHGHIPTMDTLVFSADEKTLAAGFWSDNVLLWDVANRRSYRPANERLPGTSHNVYRSPSGKIISINGSGNNLNMQEVGESEPIVELIGPEGGLGRAKAFSPTGHRIASVDKDNNIHIWERTGPLNSGQGSGSWEKHTTVINDEEFTYGLVHNPTGLAFSPDGKRLASISRSQDWKAGLWDVDSGEQISELPLTPLPSRTYTYCGDDTGIAFSPRGDIIASGKWGEIVLWDATDGKTLMSLPQPEDSQRPITLCFSPCGKYLASGAWWQPDLQKVPIRLWEIATGKNIATFWGHTTDVQCFAFSSDNTVLVSGGHDGAIYFWDLTPYL
ncbi:MAG: WD40 repeat domain-containing protein [Candidatus Poribacteria bacterium]|nr:WD40 repeat domain-containing protein [Candidatus Poribacteria bacterium]